jgi:hypothetical protein
MDIGSGHWCEQALFSVDLRTRPQGTRQDKQFVVNRTFTKHSVTLNHHLSKRTATTDVRLVGLGFAGLGFRTTSYAQQVPLAGSTDTSLVCRHQ